MAASTRSSKMPRLRSCSSTIARRCAAKGFSDDPSIDLLLSFFDAQIEAQYTVLVAHRHDGNAASHADFRLNDLLLGRWRQVSDVGEGDVVFDLLLDRDPGAEDVVGAADLLRVDLHASHAEQFLHPAVGTGGQGLAQNGVGGGQRLAGLVVVKVLLAGGAKGQQGGDVSPGQPRGRGGGPFAPFRTGPQRHSSIRTTLSPRTLHPHIPPTTTPQFL